MLPPRNQIKSTFLGRDRLSLKPLIAVTID